MSLLLRRARLFDTITIGRAGEPPIVLQVRSLSATGVRICIIADGDMDINHARQGKLLDTEPDEEAPAEGE